MSVMQRKITLLTGIPRSGTTLCCHLINKIKHATALHEPINPQTLTAVSRADVVAELSSRIDALDTAITQGLPFEHGDKHNLSLDNPIGDDKHHGVRQLSAKRGKIAIAPRSADTPLFIKQNALFTALLPELLSQFPVIGIVRNPVQVLLSWMSVDLPVHKGHIPAGERYDATLSASLAELTSVTDRQLYIYRWFTEKFIDATIPVVRYEDIIETGGSNFYTTLDLPALPVSLEPKQRHFARQHIDCIQQHADTLLSLSPFYSSAEIQHALDALTP